MDDFVRPVGAFLLGLLAVNAGEWAVHRFLLHGLGRHPDSLWHYHWARHHRQSRRHGMADPDYFGAPRWNTHGKELLLILAVAGLHLPLLSIAPGYGAGVLGGLAWYYLGHRKAHRDPAWARRRLPWHWEHHMGAHPDANYCTTWPGFDWLMGTRVKAPGREG